MKVPYDDGVHAFTGCQAVACLECQASAAEWGSSCCMAFGALQTGTPCQCAWNFPAHSWALLWLHPLLAMAAECIAAGVPLRTLCFEGCRTSACLGLQLDEHGGGQVVFAEPNFMELAQYYMPVGSLLRGITYIKLSESPECDPYTIGAALSLAPDVQLLDLGINGVSHKVDAPRCLECTGLRDLFVSYMISSVERCHRKVDLRLELQVAKRLESCAVQMVGSVLPGDKVTLLMDCDCLAVIEASACMGENACWELGFTMYVREAGNEELHGGARAKVTYEYSREGWAAAVSWPESSSEDMQGLE